MPIKDRSFPVSPGTALSVFCLLLYSAGFIRIETKFNDYEQRLRTVEEFMPQVKMEQARTDLHSAEQSQKLSVDYIHGCIVYCETCFFKLMYVR